MMTATRTQRRLLLAESPTLAAHLATHGAIPRQTPAQLQTELAASGLTGRGGAAFPAAGKGNAVRSAIPRRGAPVVVANGAEGEPASGKDALLLTAHPHLVLDGLQLAAAATGATDAVAYVPAGAVMSSVRRALAERRDPIAVRVIECADSFLAGQETAVVRRIGGGPALPTDGAVRVSESGLGGRPTLVHNVETLAHTALIARHGAGWFRSVGTDAEPGSLLATISGAVERPGVVEVEHGVPLAQVLSGARPDAQARAVLVGGWHGAWVPWQEAGETPYSRAGLAPWSAAPGAGVLTVLGRDTCGLRETAKIVRWLAKEGARQCGPCVNGLPALAEDLTALADGPARADLPERIERLSALVSGRGACRHPDGTVRLVRSALTVFADETRGHLGGRCTGRTS